MAKFFGKIGYAVTEETVPGVWKNQVTEKDIIGDFIRNTRILKEDYKVNNDITINNSISIVADPYAREHFHLIKYVKDSKTGVAWKVTNVEVQFPRLLLILGGEYNAQ